MTRNPHFLRCRLLPVIARAWPFENRGRSVRGRSHIPPSQRTPHQGCRAAPKLFGWSCCRTKELQLPRPVLPRSTTNFRVYRAPIQLASNATRMVSLRKKKTIITTHFFGFSFLLVTI